MGAFVPLSPSGGRITPGVSTDLDKFSGIIGWPPGFSGQQQNGLVAMVPQRPVASFGPARSGFAARSFVGDYYERIHISPMEIDAGIIGSTQTHTARVWNAYFVAQLLQAIEGTEEGLDVAGPIPPITMPALAERTWTITIGQEGPPVLDAYLEWIFDGLDYIPTIHVIGTRGVPWPFQPGPELIEACEWLTDLLPTRTAEERLCLRETPLRTWQLSHVADQAMQNTARRLMRGPALVLLPEWPLQVFADAYTGAPVPLRDGPAIVWRSVTQYEQVEIVGGVMGEVATPASAVRVMPLLICRIADAWTNVRPAGRWSQMRIGLQTEEGPDESADALYAKYLGYSFMSDRVAIGSGSAEEGTTWEADTADNQVALPQDMRTRDWPEERFTVRWLASGSAYLALRAWIYSRHGRWLPFWLPSWSVDMPRPVQSGFFLQADAFDDDEEHVVAQIGGVLYPRAVVSSELLPSGRWLIGLDTALPVGSIRLAMYLRLVRFNADRIEFRHAAAEPVSISVPCVRVPS